MVIRSEPLVRIAQMFVAKGSSVCIKGKIIYRDYEKNGEKRKMTEIALDPYQGQLILLGKKENKQQSLGDYDKTSGINI